MKNKYGIDTDAAMDEQSPPQNESGSVGEAKRMRRPAHKGHSAPMHGADHAPMPSHGAGEHPLKHLEGYKHKMSK